MTTTRIGFDVRMIENSGIGTTIREFLNHLSKDQLKSLLLFSTPGWQNPYPCPYVTVPYPIYSLKQHWAYPSLLNKHSLSLFHMPHYDVPYLYQLPMVVSIHDLTHYLYPQFSTKPFSRLYSRQLLSRATKKALHILVVSENTKKDLEKHFPDSHGKITVTYPGIDKAFHVLTKDDIQKGLNRYGLKPGYLLYIGNLRESKNTPGLLEAYKHIKQKLGDACPPLVLVGFNGLINKIDLHQPGIVYVGQVPNADLPALYNGASVFVFPSFYEGFGLPPVEAMSCGVPSVVSDRGSLPEVCGKGALITNPDSPQDMAAAIVQLLQSPQKRQELIHEGFSNAKRFDWQSFTNQTWAVYEACLKEQKPS